MSERITYIYKIVTPKCDDSIIRISAKSTEPAPITATDVLDFFPMAKSITHYRLLKTDNVITDITPKVHIL